MPPADLDAKLRASLHEALPCRCGGIPRGGAGHFSTCPAESCEDVLAAIAPIIAEARREALEEAVDEAAYEAEAHSCGSACSDRGLGPICGDVISDAIRALKET